MKLYIVCLDCKNLNTAIKAVAAETSREGISVRGGQLLERLTNATVST